ncbi:zinc finger and SCAN domain-containing protein 5B-like [Myotis daubentonii]|uniref:zinc finger and SCAN domain-containing protein 5B-like n=1 Tax=Myotis daubentonii TaxID=98922 RepID=UPI002872F9EE|nr:zinc finger and SCAN domain-containing protein 5B-like [Myotis daubentonii]
MSVLLHRWLRPDVLTKKEILDKLLLEKFMICMPLELQVLVKERCVQSCEELKVLLRKKEKPRKWKVVSFQGQKYLQENSLVQMADEEVGDTDHMLDLSVKSRSPISQTGVHPENSQEVNGELGNQPGTSDVLWGQNCGPDTESVPSVALHQELTFPVNMAADQAFSDGRGLPQGNLGWELLPAGTPQGILTEEQHWDSEKGHVLFRAFQHSEDADPLHSVHTMSVLLHRWLRPDVLNKQQILDKLLLETFMTIMPLELQVLVKERRVQSCEELKVLLRTKEKPRKWKDNTLQEQKYLLENSDVQMANEEVGDTDHMLDLSVKSRSPISQMGVHPENSQEVNEEPGNQPGTSEVLWGQGQKVFLPEAISTKNDLEGVRPMENLVKLEKDVMEDREEAVVLTSSEPPLPSSPGDSVKTEGKQNPLEGIGLERVDAGDVPPTQVPEIQALSQCPKRRGSGNPGGAPKRKRGNTPTPQEEPQEGAVSLDRGEVTRQHRCHSVGASSTVEPTGHPVCKVSRRKIPYKCQDCSKMFSYKSQLDLHLRTHTGERPFQCLDCPKRFIQASDLHVHQRIHTGQKPFCCKVCEKRFTHKSTLRNHQRVHTQEKPYQCAVCQKKFSHHGNLNVHMRTHSGLRPYPCPHCHLAFRQLGTFKRHQRTHVNEVPQGPQVHSDQEGH